MSDQSSTSKRESSGWPQDVESQVDEDPANPTEAGVATDDNDRSAIGQITETLV